MIGILAEKPSQAQAYAKALGGMTGTYQGEPYKIVASHGHLYEYKKVYEMVGHDKVDYYKRWQPLSLPWRQEDLDFSYRQKKGASDTLKNIRDTLVDCDEICIGTDDDPSGEGESIAWEIFDQLHLKPRKWSRMYIVDETPKSVQDGFVHRKPKKSMLADPEYIESDFRKKFDYMTMPETRAATNAINGQTTLRQGRLKTAIIVIVGQQYEAIAAYKKVPAFSQAFRDEKGNLFINREAPTFKTKEEVKLDQPGTVKVLGHTVKSVAPPKLYSLSLLAAKLGAKYGLGTKVVMNTYQNMYEHHLVSYPRTEDKFITPEQFNELLPKADQIAKVIGVDPKLLTHKKPRAAFVKKGATHGANRPGTVVPKSLSDLDQYGQGAEEIYELLARNYLAMLCPDYKYDQTKACVAEHPKYVSTLNNLVALGFKAIFDSDDALGKDVATFGKIAKPMVRETFPPKPVTPNTEWLYKTLNRYNIGTGATQASTFADMVITIRKNGNVTYAVLHEKKGKILITKYGEWSYALMQGTKLADLHFTSELDAQMQDLRNGKAGWPEVKKWLDQESGIVMQDAAVIADNGVELRKKLGIKMADTERLEGTWTDENGLEVPVHLKKTYGQHTWTDAEFKKLCAGNKIRLTMTSKKGSPYTMDYFLAHRTYDGKAFVGIDSEFPKGVPDSWCGHKFTDDEKAELANKGRIHATFHSKKTGNDFDCDVTFDEQKNRIIPHFD